MIIQFYSFNKKEHVEFFLNVAVQSYYLIPNIVIVFITLKFQNDNFYLSGGYIIRSISGRILIFVALTHQLKKLPMIFLDLLLCIRQGFF